jgi:hypothetical protein
VHFDDFLKFLAKNCQNSVMVRGNLTIPTAMSSKDAWLKSKRLFSKIFLNSALSEMLKILTYILCNFFNSAR